MSRILSINEHYIKNIDEKKLFNLFVAYCKKFKKIIDESKNNDLLKSIKFLKNKAKTLQDIYHNAQYIINDTVKISIEDLKLLNDPSKKILSDFLNEYKKISKINKENLKKVINELITKHRTNFKGVGQPLRIALTGSKFGPGIYDIILSLDKNEVTKRLKIIE
tara:strand:- start:29 stop:520 length:492 start_codon:yes stop_codon:yes gene_type:complete